MTVHALEELLLSRLIRLHGGSRRMWQAALGPIRILDSTAYAHCNWAIDARGSPAQNARIEHLLDDVRGAYPTIAAN